MSVILECIDSAINIQACKIVDKYINFWSKGDITKYKIQKLDRMYYYLIFSHKKKKIDIFDDYKDSLYYTLFLV